MWFFSYVLWPGVLDAGGTHKEEYKDHRNRYRHKGYTDYVDMRIRAKYEPGEKDRASMRIN